MGTFDLLLRRLNERQGCTSPLRPQSPTDNRKMGYAQGTLAPESAKGNKGNCASRVKKRLSRRIHRVVASLRPDDLTRHRSRTDRASSRVIPVSAILRGFLASPPSFNRLV